ncbi:aminotransferase [Clostridia bacterium]|nr:aminotransferase [Clostridia bacterium]
MKYRFSEPISELKPSAIREIFKVLADPSVISFAAGNPAPETFPAAELAELSAEIWRDSASQALQYGLTEGYLPLRGAIAERLRTAYKIGSDIDDVIVVSGAQQGIQLAALTLCDRGDTILCESPSFIGSLNAFRALGIRLCGIGMDELGLLPDELENALKTQPKVRALYTIPTFQNPTGITMSAERRKTVLELCERYGVVVIEDNPYSDLYYDEKPPQAIKSLDTSGVVLYVGSFSKVISPGLRLGYVCGAREIVAKLVVAKQGVDVHSTQFAQMLVEKYLKSHDLDAHIARSRSLYKSKRDLMLNACKSYLSHGAEVIKPSGGLFLWCNLINEKSSAEFCSKAAANKVAVVPGSAFLTDTAGVTPGFRLNFSLPTDEQIETGCRLLGSLV